MNESIFYYLSWYVPAVVVVIIPVLAIVRIYQTKIPFHNFYKRISIVTLLWVLTGLGTYILTINIWFHYVYASGHAGTLGTGVPVRTIAIEFLLIFCLAIIGIFAFRWATRIKENFV